MATGITSLGIGRAVRSDPGYQAFLLLRTVFTVAPVGVVEIVAGIVVAVVPRFGALLVAAWLAGIIVNLLTIPGFYDIALRDFGLFVAAVALARLAAHYAPAGRGRVS